MSMRTRTVKRLIQEGDYLAEVEVDVMYGEDPWSPYLSVENAEKLDEVRLALRDRRLEEAAQHARVFELTPVRAA